MLGESLSMRNISSDFRCLMHWLLDNHLEVCSNFVTSSDDNCNVFNILCRLSFYLHPCEGSTVQMLTQGKLSAPRILRVHKVSLVGAAIYICQVLLYAIYEYSSSHNASYDWSI